MALSPSGRSMSQEVGQLLVHLSFDCYSGADGSMGFTPLPFATFPNLSALTGVLPGLPQVFFYFILFGTLFMSTLFSARGKVDTLCSVIKHADGKSHGAVGQRQLSLFTDNLTLT